MDLPPFAGRPLKQERGPQGVRLCGLAKARRSVNLSPCSSQRVRTLMTALTNRQIKLAARPVGMVKPTDFTLSTEP
ncbi:MAG: hypothetical protein ACJ8LN_08420, partial [Sulfurifustis sp.]